MLKIKHWSFSPSLWPSVAVVLLLPLLVSLGFWQLDRAEEKRIRYETFMQRQTAAPINLNMNREVLKKPGDILWQRVFATGVFADDKIILLDNQIINAQAGYFVFTPFLMRGELKKYTLVNRGWVAAGNNRSEVPEFDKTGSEATIKAVIKKPPFTGIRLNDLPPEKMSNRIYRAQDLDIDRLSGLLGLELSEVVLRLEPESDYGFTRTWSVPGSGEAKHLGYAFQWFAMAVALLAIYLVVNTKKERQSSQ